MGDEVGRDSVEELLGSRGAMRILGLLSRSGDLNISEIAKRLGLNHATVQRHINRLVEAGMLREGRYGRVRIIGLAPREVRVRFIRGKGVKVELIE
ncbi:MarR family transcriptional regulator [Candidatus Bathyarchaeota archaeon]|nr:MAG: MarR family transcriptional regulator [Candidatus Bathyarchaeota archaeon]